MKREEWVDVLHNLRLMASTTVPLFDPVVAGMPSLAKYYYHFGWSVNTFTSLLARESEIEAIKA
jgi:hypothetical protein